MEEKEERIRVLVSKNPCKECSVKKCTRKCTFGLLFEKAPGITRTEAIERMAKAFVEYEKTNNPNACEWTDLKKRAKDIYRERAEAALNALLEADK